MNVQMRIVTDDNVDQLLSMSYSDNINKLLQVDNKELKDVTKEYTQKMNALIYKDNNTIKGVYIEEPVIPEPVMLTSEEQTTPPNVPVTPVYDPNSPPYAPGTPVYDPNSPPYAPNSPAAYPQGTSPNVAVMPQNISISNPQQNQQFINIPVNDVSNSTSPSMPSLENATPQQQKEIIINPNILEVEQPKETQEEEKNEEQSNESETKKVNISEDTTPSSNSNDSKKITF
jgi:hypothetical protein